MVVLACGERVTSSWYGSHLQLLDDLFTNYSKAVRPGGADGSTSVVEMVLRPVKLLNLDERAESIELKMIIEVYWHDHSLMWDESSYNDISSIHTEQSKLWLPPIIIENSLTKTDRLSEYGNKLISIDSEGNLLWTILDNYLTTCDIDISFYPFDEQDCQISLSTFPIPESHVSIKVNSPRRPLFNTVWFNTGGTWQLVESYFHVISYDPKSSYFYTGFEKSFEYHLRLRRRTTFYIFNIILPVVFLSLTTTIVFLLPAEAGEKMGVSMAVLLAYSVYLSIIADDLPRSSSQVCYLQVYLTMLLAVTALGVILSVLVLKLHHTAAGTPVGAVTRTLVIYIRSWLCCLDRGLPETGLVHPETSLVHTERGESTGNVDPENKYREKWAVGGAALGGTVEEEGNMGKTSHRQEIQDQEEMSWTFVAETVDRAFFILFSFSIFFITVTILPYIILS